VRFVVRFRSFVISEGWMDVCVVSWGVMDEASFDRDFDVDGQFGCGRCAFCGVDLQDEGKLDVAVYYLSLTCSWRAMVGLIFVM